MPTINTVIGTREEIVRTIFDQSACIAALEKELAEANHELNKADLAFKELYVHGQALQSALATITAERDKAVKDEREALKQIETYANEHRLLWGDTSALNAIRLCARATLDGIREAGKDNG